MFENNQEVSRRIIVAYTTKILRHILKTKVLCIISFIVKLVRVWNKLENPWNN